MGNPTGDPDKPAKSATTNAPFQQFQQLTKQSQAPTAKLPVLTPATTTTRYKYNTQIHTYYTQSQYPQCLQLCELALQESYGQCEYALYIKALIQRHNGQVQQSLQLFQACTILNPHNLQNLKQVGKSLFLLGRYSNAKEVYEEVWKILQGQSNEDWEVVAAIGICEMYMKNYGEAVNNFRTANAIAPHDSTYQLLVRCLIIETQIPEAIETLLEALEYTPESSELLTTLGLLYLRNNENYRSFDFLGNSLTYDPRDFKTLLAAGSIIQDYSDYDVALVKYRIAAIQQPDSSHLWNNIGMCFYGKMKYVACIACLKRALYLEPFEWIITYNLGLVHLKTQQYASAFHYFSTTINLNATYASTYMYLGVTLEKLDDKANACAAYEKGVQLDNTDVQIVVNYAALLWNMGASKDTECKKQLQRAHQLYFDEMDEESQKNDAEIGQQIQQLQKLMAANGK